MTVTSRVSFVLLLIVGLALLLWSRADDRAGAQATPPSKRNPPVTPKPRETSPPRPSVPQIEMVNITGGSFLMGSPDGEGDNDEHPQHRVTVSSFAIGKYEVTQAQWRAVMGGRNPSSHKGDNLPVENVSWNDAKDFCRKLSQMAGKEYRLPTEAEWEYAARPGSTTKWSFGDLKYCASGRGTNRVLAKTDTGFISRRGRTAIFT